MDDNQLIAAWVKWLSIAFLGVVLACTGSCQVTKYAMSKAIQAGAPPLEAKCAFAASDSVNSCLLLYAKR